MTSPSLKPSKEWIQHYKKELQRLRTHAEEMKNEPPKPAPKPQVQKKQEPKIHAPVPSPIQQMAITPMVPCPRPQSTVATYQVGNELITERKTFA